MNVKKLAPIAPLLTALAGCTIMDGGSIVTGKARGPAPAEAAQIYRSAPDKFEEIAMVSAIAGHDFKKSSELPNSAMQRPKEEAAKLGANGVLLTEIDERDAPSATTSHGTAIASGGGTSAYATGSAVGVNRQVSGSIVQVDRD